MHVQAWSADTLEQLVEVAGAHQGEKIHCIAVGPDGILYTGGDDKVGRGVGDRC